MRSTHQTHKRQNTNRLVDNLNKQKFTTNIDHDMDDKRKQNEEMSKRKNMTTVEPVWQDFNSTIEDICRQKEDPKQNMNRSTRGPSQP